MSVFIELADESLPEMMCTYLSHHPNLEQKVIRTKYILEIYLYVLEICLEIINFGKRNCPPFWMLSWKNCAENQ